ncbi:MAG: serine/threonine protein kinase [Deltaproteobacteria bacterium]|nr:serine/threonine protein kinase [Deltaproteobacteria bacterium]
MRPQVGEVINGKYRLVRLIGEGGMGSVFEARHEYLGSAVALKFLDPDLARRPGLVARFLQEARVSASVRSAHVVLVSDVDQSSNGLPYLVMELLEGESLQRMLSRSGRLPVNSALDIAVQMLNGLEAAHTAHIVHRDLKPDNVFVVPTRQGPLIKLLDFGIAKLRVSEEFQKGLTRPGVLMGTPEYMAPEQAFSADTADHRADIYSLGVILFEMITGRRPVAGDDPRIMAANVMAGKVPSMLDIDPSVPPGLSAIAQRAMAGRTADRFADAGQMRDALLPFFSATPNSGLGSQGSRIEQPIAQPLAQPPPGPAKTVPGDDPQPVPGGVAPTLPPEEPVHQQGPGRTGTVVGAAPAVGTEYGSTAQMSPYGYGPPPAPPPPAMPMYPMTAPPATRIGTRRGLSLGLIAAILGVLAGGAAIAVIVAMNRNQSEGPDVAPTQTIPTVTNTGVATTQPTETATQPPATTPTTTTPHPTATATATGPGPVTPKKDAGAEDAGADAGGKHFPFPFPSQVPSSFPIPLPSFPVPIPGFPP